jgi:formate dehydrogenase
MFAFGLGGHLSVEWKRWTTHNCCGNTQHTGPKPPLASWFQGAFGVKLHYFERHRLPAEIEKELGLTFHAKVEDMVKVCDVVTINAPLHPGTQNMFNEALLSKMKRGAYIVNTARAEICDRDGIVRALESGRLAGYAGDVWFPQPAPKDHPWRSMPNQGMTPHMSGTSLSAQSRYAAGTREILECWFDRRPIRNEYLIVEGGKLAGTGAQSYTVLKEAA